MMASSHLTPRLTGGDKNGLPLSFLPGLIRGGVDMA